MFVVTLPTSANPLSFAKRAKKEGVDLLEIRGDLTPNIEPFESPLPLLLSPRGTGDQLLTKFKPAMLDLELGEDVPVPKGVTLIRSFHDYIKTPEPLKLHEIIHELSASGADIIKVATMIRSYGDIARLEDARTTRVPEGQRCVLLCMGPKAHLSRMLSPFRNTLTYTYLDDNNSVAESRDSPLRDFISEAELPEAPLQRWTDAPPEHQSFPAAPGQIPLSMYKRIAHCKNPKVFGLLGGPECIHSLSPLIHNILFERHNIDALYSVFPTEELSDAIPQLYGAGLSVQGFSVTAPWKKDILLRFTDACDPLAEKLQSVNTLVLAAFKSTGYNTDVLGIMKGYPFLSTCSSAAILGSGGVVPSVIEACKQSGIAQITIYARNASERQNSATAASVRAEPLEALKEAKPDVVMYTIPVDTEIELPMADGAAHAIDLRYGKGTTAFMDEAIWKHYRAYDGLPMLIHQALAQFQLFTGTEPTNEDLHAIQEAVLRPVSSSLIPNP